MGFSMKATGGMKSQPIFLGPAQVPGKIQLLALSEMLLLPPLMTSNKVSMMPGILETMNSVSYQVIHLVGSIVTTVLYFMFIFQSRC